MRTAVLAVVLLTATACMGDTVPDPVDTSKPGPTALTIEISPGKGEGPTKLWTLICPDRGSLPNRQNACKRLDAIEDPFAPVPKNVACTQIYGGPQVAYVRGRFHDRRIATRFSRGDGCEIDRWNRVRFLFPSAG
jgi:hypothetical protein